MGASAPASGHEELAVWRDADGAVAARCYRHRGARWIDIPTLASFRLDHRTGVQAIAHPAVPSERIVDAHRRAVLPLALQALGREVLHASAVLTERGSLALCGVSGAGKSTLAYALRLRGHPLQADDAVVLEVGQSPVRLVPLPFEPRLLPGSASIIADGARGEAPPSPPRLAAAAEPTPLAAVVAIERGGSKDDVVTLTRLSASDALLALLSHAFCFSPSQSGRLRSMIEHYLVLARTVPTYRLRFRAGREHVAAVLDSIEAVVS